MCYYTMHEQVINMDDNLIKLLVYFGTIIGTNEFNNYLERKNFAEFNQEFENVEFSSDDVKIIESKMTYSKTFNLLVGINIIVSFLNYYYRDKKMKDLKLKVRSKLAYIEALRKQNEEIEKYRNGPRNYFVGYYEDNKPIVIWFTFDGLMVHISPDSAAPFMVLNERKKRDILLGVFSDLIKGVDGYMYSDNIIEVLKSPIVKLMVMEYLMEKDDHGRTR